MRLAWPHVGAGGVRGRPSRRLASGVTLSLVASTLVLLAIKADGTPISDVNLHDGSVWVTNTDPEYQMIGRLNPQIRQLDIGIQAMSGDFDVFQDGATVFLHTRSGGSTLRQVDVAAGIANDPVMLSPTTKVAFGGDTLALADTESGAAWVRNSRSIQGFVHDQTDPDLASGRDGAVSVGVDGTAYFFNRDKRTVTTVGLNDAGLPDVGRPTDLPAGFSGSSEATVVGNVPVLYDRESAKLLWPDLDEPVRIATDDPSSVRLQAASEDADGVYVATRSSLLLIDLTDGTVTTLREGFDGPPAAPVVHRGYVHAAWADPTADAYVRLHGDDTHAERIPGVSPTANLVFRVNRDVVVLNDTVTGVSWLVQEPGLPRVDNWDDLRPSKERKRVADPEPDRRTKARRSEENNPPTAHDDEFGARASADSVLPLTRNDLDLDGDILTIDKFKHLSGPKPVEMSVVGDGTMLQTRFGPDADGREARFSYTVTDGRERGTDDASVTVKVVPRAQNREPELISDGPTRRQTELTVARGQRASAYVLQDWTDPDGDPLVLTDARTEDGGAVAFRSDGMVEFIDDGRSGGKKTIDIQVSDGHRDGESKGKVVVNVSRRPGVPPVLVPDRAVGLAGTGILVAPLANDFSRDGTPLNLRDVSPLGGLEVTPDADAGTFVARTAQAGTYYLTYSAYTDTGEAQSFVRLDVLPRGKDNLPPVAMRDEALIPPGGHTLVDLLANDSDPEGDLLAVTGHDLPPNTGVKASLLDNRLLRLEASRELPNPITITYSVSDGVSTSQGSVTVGQAKPRAGNRAPVAQDDRLTVRAGAVASVPVLDNDFDPDGDELQLFQQDIVKPDDLPLFASGRVLRFRAPSTPGEFRATYGVRDARGQRDDAELIVNVIADNAEVNAAPRPDPVAARAVGPRPARIDLDLGDADPDGDAVSLKGLRTAPALGRVTATGLDWIEYQPYTKKNGGTDAFEVEVQDKYGAVGVQEVRIAVVPRSATNQAPVALDDKLLVRPGRTIQYDVLANDADADGDEILLSDELQKDEGAVASVEDGFVTVKVPKTEGSAVVQTSMVYTIADEGGRTDVARFTVDASADAPLYAPLTRDDAAELADIAGKQPGKAVLVDVLDNDGDLDGRKEDLRVVAFDEEVSNVVDNQLNIVLSAQDQVVAYEVRDADDNVSFGFVFVAGTETVPPVINPAAKPNPIEVHAGGTAEIDLEEYVLVRAGRKPILTVADKVASAPMADGVEVDGSKGLRFTAPPTYHGPASVTFEVTDGSSLNDETGLTSLLTLPIDVVPPDSDEHNLPPELRDIEVLLVGGDDAEEKRVDLAGNASDPNPDDVLEFSAESTDQVDARVEGSTLVLNAKPGIEDGEVSDVPIAVEDLKGETAEAIARVRLVRSDKPLVTVGTIGPIEGEAGKPVSVDINDHATNPYEGRPLTVSGGTMENGKGEPDTSGSLVTVTPADRFSGSITVRFIVLDGSDDPEREVTARLEVDVVAAPEPPGRPTISNSTHNSVTLSWSAAEDMGAPITGHTITWPGGSHECGAGTTCTVDGLTPGETYSFRVAATNRAGTSEESAPSDEVTPDKVPELMNAPTIRQNYKDRDRQLTLEWKAPENVGSAIRTYEIHMLGTSDIRNANSSPFVWTGLTNGKMNRFRIRAVNDITEEDRKQRFSEPSIADKAFAAPDQVAKPTATASADDGIPGGTVQASWTAPADNGDAIEHYEITMRKDGKKVTTKRENGTSSHFDVENGHDYTFTVLAFNRAGKSLAGDASDPVNPWDKAEAVRDLVKVDAGEGDRKGRISFAAPADDGGRPIVQYQITSNGGTAKTVTSAGTYDIAFTANNGPYTVTVVPVTQVPGKSASVAGISPFGKPGKPTGGTGSPAYRQVNFSGWRAGARNGRNVKTVQYRKTGGSWTTGTSTTWATAQGGDQRCIDVRTVAEGRTPAETLYSDTEQICGKASPRTLEIFYTNAPDGSGPCLDHCKWINFRISGFASNRTYTIDTNIEATDRVETLRTTIRSDGNGRGTKNSGWAFNSVRYANEEYCAVVDGIRDCRKGNE